MVLKTYVIELRTDYDDPSKDETILQAVRTGEKHMLTTSMLIADKRQPSIAIQVGDLFESEKEISLADDIPPDGFLDT